MKKSTAEKALQINLTKPLYGSLAEIGAGQEVARWFFKVGGAAGTIAKAMSAYDMAFSDAIYGREACGRYVVESRLRKMLNHEFGLLETRLTSDVDRKKYFFAFADTVAAKSFKYEGDCHGWMGVKFQRNATEEPSQVILHVRMKDTGNLQQQEALGVLGVNLIYGAYYLSEDTNALIASLVDGDIKTRIEINLIRFEGPAFTQVDHVAANLQLLAIGITPAIPFPQNQEAAVVSEEIYNKQVICHRGKFSPPLLTDLDMLRSARDFYCGNKTEGECDPYLLNEVKAMDIRKNPQAIAELKNTVSELRQCGQNVMVTTFAHTYQLTEYIGLFTKNHINIVYRASRLIEVFENHEYESLGPLARTFNDCTRIYYYPTLSKRIPKEFHKNPDQPYFKLSDYKPSSKNVHLFQHLIEQDYLREIDCFNKEYATWDHTLYDELKSSNDSKHKQMLPEALR